MNAGTGARPLRALFAALLILSVTAVPTVVALPGPEDVQGACPRAVAKVEDRLHAIGADPPDPGYIEQEVWFLGTEIGQAVVACRSIPQWYDVAYCVTDQQRASMFGIDCRPIFRPIHQAAWDCVYYAYYTAYGQPPPTTCAGIGEILPCDETMGDDCTTYREVTRYFTGGWDSIQDSYLLVCPATVHGTDIGVGAGCNFVCPQDTCRIVVDDQLINNVRFKVCVGNCNLFTAPSYTNAANVKVGAGRLFQVYLDRYWSTTGTVTSTLP